MVSVDPESSAQSLDALEAFLSSERAPPEAMPISVLDGFLTAIVIGPELVMPSVWLPEIWGGGSPDFADLAEANLVLGAIMGRYNAIIAALDADPPRCAPIFEEDDEGRVFAEHWAEGFVAGIALSREAWTEIFDDEAAYACTIPILGVCVDEKGRSRLDLEPEFVEELTATAPDLIPTSVIAIRVFWKTRGIRPPRRTTGRGAKRRTGLNR